MKASELMIEDWVYGLYPNGSRYARPFRISAIDIYPLNKSPRIVTYGGYGFQEEHLEPIPLTSEILEKNGFRKLVTYGTEKWVCNEVRLNVYDSGETWRFCADTNRNENSVIYIRFIHELQHALRLCGIKKEITI